MRIVQNNDDLLKVAQLRLAVYRLPSTGLTGNLERAIDADDYADNSVVLAAFDKITDDVIGTMRVSFSTRGKTTMQALADLPGFWGTMPYGEARMLCVPKSEHSRMVLLMLCKAFFQSCRIEGLENIIIGARRAMEPFYRILCFDDVRNPPLFFTPPTINAPHRILGLQVSKLESIWAQHETTEDLRHIFFTQRHADIDLGNSGPIVNPLSRSLPPTISGEVVKLQAIASLMR